MRNSELDHPSASAVYRLFQRHLAEQLYRALTPDDLDLQTAKRWLSRFDTPLRTLDALHLSMAVNRRVKLWTTDKALARAARRLRVPHRLITA